MIQEFNSFKEYAFLVVFYKKMKKRIENKLKYNCKDCEFTWEGRHDTFYEVLIHEKTHKITTTKLSVME